MKDIAALPTNMALTLFDALPVYLGVALALAVLARIWLPRVAFDWYWRRRRVLDPTGVLYLVLYYEALALPYLILLMLATLAIVRLNYARNNLRVPGTPRLPLLNRGSPGSERTPSTPARALRATLSETVTQLLIAGVVAALVNIFGPRVPDGVSWLAVPVIGVLALGPNPGAAAIPAVAAASTSGSLWIGIVWLTLSFSVSCVRTLQDVSPDEPDRNTSRPPMNADA